MNYVRELITRTKARLRPTRIVSAVGTAAGASSARGNAGVAFRASTRVQHPLDPAFARIGRADDHLRDLAEKVEKRSRDQVNAFGLRPNPEQPGSVALDVGLSVALPVDPIFGILVGEISYNLRAALDYLVYELAILHAGSIKRTQFPIDNNPSHFNARTKVGGFLEGVSPAHVAELGRHSPLADACGREICRKFQTPISTVRCEG